MGEKKNSASKDVESILSLFLGAPPLGLAQACWKSNAVCCLAECAETAIRPHVVASLTLMDSDTVCPKGPFFWTPMDRICQRLVR